MRAITVMPGRSDSARLDDIPEPLPDEGAVLVEAIAVGVCGTDREILSGLYIGRLVGGSQADGRRAVQMRSAGRLLAAPS
jgi:threonine dehydrogenase-like Zn-dependent dehydrogenase